MRTIDEVEHDVRQWLKRWRRGGGFSKTRWHAKKLIGSTWARGWTALMQHSPQRTRRRGRRGQEEQQLPFFKARPTTTHTQMSWATELFGADLLTKDGAKPTAEVLADKKFVALYFSAHVRRACESHTRGACRVSRRRLPLAVVRPLPQVHAAARRHVRRPGRQE